MPGQVQSSGGRTWHEEIDQQWQPYYKRRPPSISQQLHFIIREMESTSVASASVVLAVPLPAALPRPLLDSAAVLAHRKAARKGARKGVALLARKKRREAVADAIGEHERWVQEEQAALDAEHSRLTGLVNGAVAAWRAGEPNAVFVVANAMLAAGGANGSLVSLIDDVATLLVFAPPLEDVHPCKPAISPSGAPTVNKRTKLERVEAHRVLAGASAVSALNAVRHAIPGVRRLDVVVVSMSSSTGNLGDCPVLAAFTANYAALPRSANGFARLVEQHTTDRPKLLRTVVPDLFGGDSDDLAVASMCESLDDLKLPEFWLEVSAAVAALNSTQAVPVSPWAPPSQSHTAEVVPAPAAQPGRRVASKRTAPAGPSSPPSSRPARPRLAVGPAGRLPEHLEALAVIDDSTTALAHWPVVVAAIDDLSAVSKGQVDRDLISDLLLTLARCASYTENLQALHRLTEIGDHLEAPDSVVRALDRTEFRLRVADTESTLRALLVRSENAARDADPDGISACWTQLLDGLTAVPEGADDEAADVARALSTSIAVLQWGDELQRLDGLLCRCHPSVQARLKPIVAEIGLMLGDVNAILAYIAGHPGSLQSTLSQRIGVDQSRVRTLLWYLALFGRVTRTKKGNSYLLDSVGD